MKYVLIASLSVVTILSGCASGVSRIHSSDTLKYSDYAGAPIERFTAFNINGWESLARDKLIVWTGVNEAYMLTVWSTCPDLEFVQRVGLQHTGSMISRLDSVRVGHTRCPIQEIRPLDIKQMKADRAAMQGK
jgi:hypothetical protein